MNSTAKKSGQLRICLAASAGGHLTQILKLRQCWQGQQVLCITTSSVVKKLLENEGKTIVVGESNHHHPLRVAAVFFKCLRELIRFGPDIIISTGASVGCLSCLIGKLLGARVIWIDSFTNINRISLSGRLIRRFSDIFLVQWPSLADNRNIRFWGRLI